MVEWPSGNSRRGNSRGNTGRGSSSRGGSSRGNSRGGRGKGNSGRGNEASDICFDYQRTGECRRAQCSFSHGEPSSSNNQQPRQRREESAIQEHARVNYNKWKRIIKREPVVNDTHTMKLLWTDALGILNDDDREWKQMLPRDLDSDELHGAKHILALLQMKSGAGGARMFIVLAQPFLEVMVHQAILDCLSIDTFVGRLYNLISGSNGSRAIQFFQSLLSNLLEAHDFFVSTSTQNIERVLVAMVTCLRELLRREHRALFNDSVVDTVNSIENCVEVIGIDKKTVTATVIGTRMQEIRGMIARAKGLLDEGEETPINGVSTSVVVSTYPRDIIMPSNRHDNDKLDITEIEIVPTEDEIRSDSPEFLPSTDPDQPHYISDQAARLLDTHFRLLRHDVFGELKAALGSLIVAVEDDPSILGRHKPDLGNVRANLYHNAWVQYITFDDRRDLQAEISFTPPAGLRKKSVKDRSKWWDESKRLDEGILLCMLSYSHSKCTPLFLFVTEKRTDPKSKYNLVSHDHQATIIAKLATQRQKDLDTLIRLSTEKTEAVLIEIPGVLLATVSPILENLQNMHKLGRLPFRQWILPDRTRNSRSILDVPPPLYARKPGFAFSLSPILKDESSGDLRIDPSTCSVNDTNLVDKIELLTELDRGQCEALLAALVREFCQIQGPPGTGKSFLGVKLVKVLLHCMKKQPGPIIIVCYTNHALDQFLEHLLESGIEKLIRIGGQSKSSILEGKNLRVVSKGESQTKSERYLLAKAYESLEIKAKFINSSLAKLSKTKDQPDYKSMEGYIARHYPHIHRQFSRFDDEGFEQVGGEPFDLWLKKKGKQTTDSQATYTVDQLLATASLNIHALSIASRFRLVDHWKNAIRETIVDDLHEAVRSSELVRQNIHNIHDDVDRRVLQTAQIIGVTTTGLARKISTLRHVNSKVIICEEAGEVLEAHLLSTLLPSVEHVVSIGDHEQLRPQINNFKDLSLESRAGTLYQLDRSQFERLSVGQNGRSRLPVAQLNIQRRMRPEISKLINRIYPELIDHGSTKVYPDVVGMRQNVFWLDHEKFQDDGLNQEHKTMSHSNQWEVEMTAALVRHIVRQGEYSSSDIAVLTPYSGQLQKLRNHMRKDFEIVLSDRDQDTLVKDGFIAPDSDHEEKLDQTSDRKALQKKKLSELLRIATVDNFQGEEAKVVIVSLVRSNKDKKVGFLKTTNRINVLLSRAQHGLYLIGNTQTYSSVQMWADVIGILREAGSVGQSFGLCCPRHPDDDLQASQPDDFLRLSPEGGCSRACNRRLSDCGHRCLARCHSESMHAIFKCPQRCERLHQPCGHSCQKPTCGEDCGPCRVKFDNIQLPCKHIKDGVECYLTGDLAKVRCMVMVQKKMSGCDHIIEVPCSQDITLPGFHCPAICGAKLPCAHACTSTCGKCTHQEGGKQVTKHPSCTKTCNRPLSTCNHSCKLPCHEGKECGLCSAPCEVQCSHSKCTLKCHQACAPCIERCTWSCEHQERCNMPCAGPCDKLPCNKRCSSKLSCGHQCPGLCGEPCPEDYCQICSTKQDARVDLLEMKLYGDIDLDETPIVALGCKHFFTAETLDGMVGMSEVYEQDILGNYTAIKDATATLASSIPRCPDCKCPLRQFATPRYNRVINRAVIDEMSKRFLVTGQTELRELESEINKLEQELDDTRQSLLIMNNVNGITSRTQSNAERQLKERQDKSRKLGKRVDAFCKKVMEKHQPATKLHDATVNAIRQRSIEDAITSLSLSNTRSSPRDRRITRGAHGVQLKLQYIVLTDKFPLSQKLQANPKITIKLPGGAPDQPSIAFFRSCLSYISSCQEDSLPKLAVEGILYYAKIARLYDSYTRSISSQTTKKTSEIQKAKDLLEEARNLCSQGFQNADSLLTAVEESIKFLRREWYEEVTKEELDAIKKAMVSGRGGIATHSGHWYECENGHPFAIGECGMPMQLARCPECGARIGGQSHNLTEGVVRSDRMER
ncbi:hypothetical protein sscle_06g049280 [Sclerotinia sclerotiorum 1980 UF-70]|uniref:Uncharacterized protein n=2 Tax=Sclerotinia sclerotiorum (strain ATCC 18683 / 1980 / Ss-1) TaxID=665079 RepID=A0A1D9Q5D3_SCLS1|nr:hypothetical protein sscle_06g049280 [Sclerotinia sclerotiorum 1980 UF-70]